MAQSSGISIGGILTWGLVIAAGYFLWNAYESATTPAAAAPAGGTTPPAGSGTSSSSSSGTSSSTSITAPPASSSPGPCPMPNLPSAMGGGSGCPPTTDSLATQQTKVAAAAQAGGTDPTSSQNASIWNWYFNTAYNLPTSTSWLLGDNGLPMTLAAYMALRKSAGFSGLGSFGARRIALPVMFRRAR